MNRFEKLLKGVDEEWDQLLQLQNQEGRKESRVIKVKPEFLKTVHQVVPVLLSG